MQEQQEVEREFKGIVMRREQEFWEVGGEEEAERVIPAGNFVLRYKTSECCELTNTARFSSFLFFCTTCISC